MAPVSASRSFVESFGSSLVTLVAGLGTGIIAARVLGPSERGVLAQVFFWAQFLAPLGAISIADAIVIHARRGHDVNALVQQAYILMAKMLCLILPVGGVIILAAMRGSATPVVISSLIFWVVQACVMSFDQVTTGSLKNALRFRVLSITSALIPLMYIISLLIMLVFSRSYLVFVVAQAAALLLTVLIRFKFSQFGGWSTSVGGNNVQLLATALNIHRTTVVHLLSSQIDRLLVVQTLSNSEIGLYFVAVSLAGPLQGFIGVAVSQIALSKFVHVTGAARELMVERLLRLSWMVSLIGAVAVVTIAPIVAPLLFGKAFSISGYVAAGLTAATATVPVRLVAREASKSMNDNGSPFRAELGFLLGFGAAFIPAFFVGVPYPVIAGLASGNILSTYLILRALAVHMPTISLRRWIIPRWSTFSELFMIVRNARSG
ncbi:oligosaccharide flippase family protein [Mesorhizobium sp. M0601]|uniref:lipopolysaccharide biosynthesis protein n=1 Tax=Mesorhizobium sp. M0601 TaxID=2956969 RepID=UPI003337BEDD